jgi:hypothetical protein
MKTKMITIFSALFLIVGLQTIFAQQKTDGQKEIMKEKRTERRGMMKEKWDSMSDEEKQAFTEKRMAHKEARKEKSRLRAKAMMKS